ncbi:MAG TPA: sodium/proline symporter [Clostridiales bacterium]|nr:sodium/proline symporter [Clostridiales bacterium]
MEFILLGIYFVILIAVGFYSMRRTSSLQDFFLGGRNIGPWMSAFAYGTTYFSAVIFIGYAGRIGWDFGISAVWIAIGNAVLGSYLAWRVLAKQTRYLTHRLDVSTMPEFFEKRYDSKALKVFSAIIIFIFLVPYSASVYQGLSYLFEQIFGIPFIYCMIGMAAVTGLYLIMGGYFAMALTDFIQGIIMVVGIVLMVIYVVSHPNVGGLAQGMERLQAIEFELTSPVGPGGFIPLFSLVLLTSLGSWGLPQMIHKFYAIRDEESVRRATWISSIFAILVAGGAYFTGAFGRLFLNNEIPIDAITGTPNADMIMPKLLQVALPKSLMGIILILVLSASMSTLSSIVLVSSSAISMDLIKGVLAPNMKKKNVMIIMQILCVVFVILSFVMATTNRAGILTLMSFSWGTIAGSFLAPFLYGLYWKGVTKAGAWAGFLSGFLTSIILAIVRGLNAGDAPMIGTIAMLVSLAVVPVVSLVTPKFSTNHIETIYGEVEDSKLEFNPEIQTIQR